MSENYTFLYGTNSPLFLLNFQPRVPGLAIVPNYPLYNVNHIFRVSTPETRDKGGGRNHNYRTLSFKTQSIFEIKVYFVIFK